MYDEWAETTEGKAWLEKKAEKKAKQKEIQAKIRLTLNRESFVSAFDLGFFEDLSGMCEDLRPMHQKDLVIMRPARIKSTTS